MVQHLSLSAHCCRSPPLPDAAVRPVEAAIRAERSILSAGKSVNGQSFNSLRCRNGPKIGGLSHSANVHAHHYRTHTGASLF
jgi:hypothetical protein